MKKYYILFIFLIILLNSCSSKIDENNIDFIKLPNNFEINIYSDLDITSVAYPGPNPGPRFMEFKDDILFLSISRQGMVVALPDKNNDNVADEIILSVVNLNNPHGLAFYEDWLYIAEEDKVIRIKDTNNDLVYDIETLEIVVDNLPKGGHWTRTIKIFNDSLYLSVGSSCNACIENDNRRAAISKCSLEGECEIFASGIRNAVGFIFHPLTNEIYATENSRDRLGEDTPPDEIDIIKENGNYGWPICYGKNILDTDFHKDDHVHIRPDCTEPFEIPSLVDLQAHSAPLGLAFYYGQQFPKEYEGKLFVAYHGSWNRKVPTGYKIVVIDVESKEVKDFATGWLTDNFKVLGRPVDVIVDKEGSLFVSDDNAGLVYKITYR